MNGNLRHRLRLGLLLAGVALGGDAVAMGGENKPNRDLQAVRAVPVGQAPLIADAPAGALSERPLFDPSRRPEAPAETPIPVPVAPPPVTLSLSGIVGDTATGFTAIFRLSSRPELQMVREGDRIDRWTVSEVTEAVVLLRDDDGAERVVSLR